MLQDIEGLVQKILGPAYSFDPQSRCWSDQQTQSRKALGFVALERWRHGCVPGGIMSRMFTCANLYSVASASDAHCQQRSKALHPE